MKQVCGFVTQKSPQMTCGPVVTNNLFHPLGTEMSQQILTNVMCSQSPAVLPGNNFFPATAHLLLTELSVPLGRSEREGLRLARCWVLLTFRCLHMVWRLTLPEHASRLVTLRKGLRSEPNFSVSVWH